MRFALVLLSPKYRLQHYGSRHDIMGRHGHYGEAIVSRESSSIGFLVYMTSRPLAKQLNPLVGWKNETFIISLSICLVREQL